MKLTNVHDALSRAVDSSHENLVIANFRVEENKKRIVEQICKQNGTTLSCFLRECIDGLLDDYVGKENIK